MRMFDEDFVNVVRAGDRNDIKSAIIGFVDTDKYMADFLFHEAAEYAHAQLFKQTGKGLIEQDDGKWSLPSDKALWDEDLWQIVKIKLMHSISREKLAAMEALMLHLRATGVPRFQIEDNAFTQSRKRSQEALTSVSSAKKLLPVCLVGGAVAGLVIGAVIKAKLAGAIIGCAAGVGVYYYLKKRSSRA